MSLKIELMPSYLLQLEHYRKGIQITDQKVTKINNQVYTIFIHSILNRSANYIYGFQDLLIGHNYMSSGVILRCHLDNLLKLYASTLVADKEIFVGEIMQGVKITSMKTAEGEKMTEFILHEKLSKLHPWVTNVYSKTSGLVHFSKTHIFACTESVVGEEFKLEFSLQRSDYKVRDKERIEAIQCMVEITSLIIKMVELWLDQEIKILNGNQS